ncbi:hypothetical protein M1K46_23450 [Fictibacillus sp. WQ 8-8]|uniref:YozN n=1 Tax=Fictibacillus marinisediminis TaxID=2878389 RepID=A0A9X2BFF1_9BACL|nr:MULTISPECIES: hypothetical protein [unclassified Fictibacillus]MCK6255403.1 hypothetical protein [Fictibacillus marinisediminis]MCQ6268537.1 hypothetical protein [Fictibacillus sp. WQ 8-8]UZJ78662.1 hypothetical protein OKX00_21520 [Fictibacillus sp. KU28468]SFE62979.1 Spore germination protein gerPA/gerPF [Bacillus sp. OV194]
MGSPSIVINIFLFKINSFENASAVNIGENYLSDWHNSDKKNQGFGQSFGDDARFFGNENSVDDRDAVDSPVTQSSYGREIPSLIEKI